MLQHGGWSQKGQQKCWKIIIVSEAVEGTFVDLDGEGKASEKMEAVKRS